MSVGGTPRWPVVSGARVLRRGEHDAGAGARGGAAAPRGAAGGVGGRGAGEGRAAELAEARALRGGRAGGAGRRGGCRGAAGAGQRRGGGQGAAARSLPRGLFRGRRALLPGTGGRGRAGGRRRGAHGDVLGRGEQHFEAEEAALVVDSALWQGAAQRCSAGVEDSGYGCRMRFLWCAWRNSSDQEGSRVWVDRRMAPPGRPRRCS